MPRKHRQGQRDVKRESFDDDKELQEVHRRNEERYEAFQQKRAAKELALENAEASEAKAAKIKAERAKHEQRLQKYEDAEKAALAPYVMMNDAMHSAGGESHFNKDVFKKVLKGKFLGDDFENCKAHTDEKIRAKLVAAEKKFDADLEKMASAMQAGVADETYDKPQKNGALKRCFRGVMNSLAAIVAIVPPVYAAGLTAKGTAVFAGVAANLGISSSTLASAGAFVGGGVTSGLAVTAGVTGTLLGGCLYAISRYSDSTDKASVPEKYMDKLVEVVDKHFISEMKKISDSQLSKKPNKVQRSAERFQERFGKIESGPKTFEGREEAKRRESSKKDKSL